MHDRAAEEIASVAGDRDDLAGHDLGTERIGHGSAGGNRRERFTHPGEIRIECASVQVIAAQARGHTGHHERTHAHAAIDRSRRKVGEVKAHRIHRA